MMRRPKVLFIAFIAINHRYFNPTNSLFPAAFSKVFSTHFYGPGFVSQEALEAGVDRYVGSIGGVDVVFASKDFCGGYDVERICRFINRYVVMLNGGHLTPNTYKIKWRTS